MRYFVVNQYSVLLRSRSEWRLLGPGVKKDGCFRRLTVHQSRGQFIAHYFCIMLRITFPLNSRSCHIIFPFWNHITQQLNAVLPSNFLFFSSNDKNNSLVLTSSGEGAQKLTDESRTQFNTQMAQMGLLKENRSFRMKVSWH